jgi:hypothetical protein
LGGAWRQSKDDLTSLFKGLAKADDDRGSFANANLDRRRPRLLSGAYRAGNVGLGYGCGAS